MEAAFHTLCKRCGTCIACKRCFTDHRSMAADTRQCTKYEALPNFKECAAGWTGAWCNEKIITSWADKFNNPKVFEGWNCARIQKCGSIGNICGGYGTKGAKHDIKKTFTKLPSGKYTISLDFIKIDSWYAWHVFVVGKHVNLSFAENTSAFT